MSDKQRLSGTYDMQWRDRMSTEARGGSITRQMTVEREHPFLDCCSIPSSKPPAEPALDADGAAYRKPL